jgi:hypothetical protein
MRDSFIHGWINSVKVGVIKYQYSKFLQQDVFISNIREESDGLNLLTLLLETTW